MANVKKSVADGKGLVATAISAKGIATTGADTFATMAGNVDKIKIVTSTDSGKILAGQNVNGIIGTATNDANAVAGDLLSGKTGYVKGLKVSGTIPSKAAQTYTPGVTNQSIGAGQYLSGAQTIAGSGNLVPGNIKQGVNIFGVVGDLRLSLPIAFSTTTIQVNRSVSIDCRQTDTVKQTIMSENELNGGDHLGYTLTFKAECQFGLPGGTAMATTGYTNTVMVSASGITNTQGQTYVSFNANTIYCGIVAGSENGNIYAVLTANSQGMTAKITLVSAQIKRI